MFKDLPEGQTHSYGDGCGIKEHNPIPLEKQVCSLDLARKLKELDCKQESLFYWDEGDGIEDRLEYSPNHMLRELVSAFTVAELGEMLPDFMPGNFNWVSRGKKVWIAYERAGRTLKVIDDADTEADARAKMLIYLLENKLL